MQILQVLADEVAGVVVLYESLPNADSYADFSKGIALVFAVWDACIWGFVLLAVATAVRDSKVSGEQRV